MTLRGVARVTTAVAGIVVAVPAGIIAGVAEGSGVAEGVREGHAVTKNTFRNISGSTQERYVRTLVHQPDEAEEAAPQEKPRRPLKTATVLEST